MSKDFKTKSGYIGKTSLLKQTLALLMTLIMLLGMLPAGAMAGGSGEKSVTVYLTVSNDGGFYASPVTGQAVARIPMTVPYFELSDWGLGDYTIDYDGENAAGVPYGGVKTPTVLHLLLQATKQFYNEDFSAPGDDDFTITGSAGSTYMSRFWGHDENLMYYINHAYPLTPGTDNWGATSDIILLEDGMEVDLAMFSNWNFWMNGYFSYFETSDTTVEEGQSVDFTLLGSSTSAGFGGGPVEDIPLNDKMSVFCTTDITSMANSREVADIDAAGSFSIDFDEPGTYYVIALDNNMGTGDACIAPAVTEITVEESVLPVTDITFTVTPQDATIAVYDAAGAQILPNEGTLTYSSLVPDATYTYNVSKYGYVSQRGTFVTGESAEKSVTLSEAPAQALPSYTGDWTSFRGNEQNMGLTGAKTPKTADEAELKWAVKHSSGWAEAITPPIVLNGSLYIAKGKKIVRINPETGEIIAASEDMAGSVGYALNPVTYGGGMIFVPVGLGRVQALRADTLESLWVSEQLGGQTLTPLTYKNGYLYTGTWNSETRAGTYFCLSVTDEDVSKTNETKYCTWKIDQKGGFYWAGAYATDNYVIFGSDDGESGNTSETAVLYSVSPATGKVIDTILGVKGDIRSTVSYDSVTDRIYFTTKGGAFYQVKLNEDGSFDDSETKIFDLGGMCTGTPLVYNGLAYLGVSGPSQFSPTGHSYKIIDVTTTPMKEVDSADIPGYVQTSALLSSAYNDDSNKLYVYATYNYTPGGVYVIEVEKTNETDADGAAVVNTSGSHLFTPEGDKAQYCICSLVSDQNGVIYYKNDSGYLMSVAPKRLTDKAITAFSIGSSKGIIDEDAKTVSVTVSYDADITALIPAVTVSQKASVSPASGTAVDFTNPVTYTVTAEDGTAQGYVVSVTKKSNSGGGGHPADELEADRTRARASLLEAFNKCAESDYTSVNWNLVKAAYGTGLTNIEQATTYDGVYAALNNAIEEIGKVETKSNVTVTVCVSMEKFTLGQGYIIEPTLVKVPKYTPASAVITDLLKQKYPSISQPYRMTGTVTDSFYLSYVYDTDTDVKVPNYILSALGGSLDTRGSDTLLGEFDYSFWSGWMYSINGGFPGVGAATWRLSNNEVMRWQFTLYGYGADLDADNAAWGQSSIKTLADKERLTWRVAEINAMSNKTAVLAAGSNQSKYDAAMIALTKIDSTQTEVDNALSDLNNLAPVSGSPGGGGSSGSPVAASQPANQTITPLVSVSDGSATATVTAEEASKAIEAAKLNHASDIVVAPVISSETNSISVVIPKASVDSMASATQAALQIKTAIGNIRIPNDVLSSVTKESGTNMQIKIEKIKNETLSEENKAIVDGHPVLDLSVTIDGKKITGFEGGAVSVLIPYTLKDGEDASKLTVYHISEDGKAVRMEGARYDAASGCVVFATTHFSVFAVALDKNAAGGSFSDVEDAHWAKEYIEYLVGKGIINGKTQTSFAPNDAITRAEFVAILARISGENPKNTETVFADVKAEDWYAAYVSWAVTAGITNGMSDSEFAPNAKIRRQDMAAMIVRFASYMKFELPVSSEEIAFADSEEISGYAKAPVSAMQKAGIINGKDDDKFMPAADAARAEAAKMLAVLMQLMEK